MSDQVPFLPADESTAAMIEFFGEPISTYSRAQAIEDGVLIPTTDLVTDETDFTMQAGWKVPVALTSTLADLVIPTAAEEKRGQSIKGRLWDVLSMARMYGKAKGQHDTVYFPCIFYISGRMPAYRGGSKTFHLKAVIGPGDDAEPVMTVMFRNED
jgi:hypothetical protein